MKVVETARRLLRALRIAAPVVAALFVTSCATSRYQVHHLVGLTMFQAQQDEDFNCSERLHLKVLEYDPKQYKIVLRLPTADDAKCKILYQVPAFGPRMSADGDVAVILDKAASTAAPATVKFKVPPLAFDPPKYTVHDALTMPPFNTNPGLLLQVIYFNGSVLVIRTPDDSVNGSWIKGQTPAPATEMDAGGIVGVVIDGPIEVPPHSKGGSPPN
jgi:hypothetical protein